MAAVLAGGLDVREQPRRRRGQCADQRTKPAGLVKPGPDAGSPGFPSQGGIAGSNPVGHTTSDQPDTGAVAEEVLQRRDDRVLTRVGPAVRHPRHPWRSATRALLEHLSEPAFMPSPRPVGTDGDADLLSYIPGASGADGWAPAVTEEGLAAAARLPRSYHDAVRDWRPEIEPVWFDGSVGTGGPGEVVCHGDFGPWNIAWDGSTPVGVARLRVRPTRRSAHGNSSSILSRRQCFILHDSSGAASDRTRC